MLAETSRAFYDRWFERGYMEEWPAAKKRRVAAVVKSLPLPSRGRALDFGCGQGVFAEVLLQALPSWEVYGADLSSVALGLARRRVPHGTFVTAEQLNQQRPFDLIFTHHVLEHVDNLARLAEMLAQLTAAGGTMLHILPCGNPGSLEHRLCQLQRGSIDPATGLFVFEDPSHVRRLSSAALEDQFGQHGLECVGRRFANQFWGGVDWISDAESDVIRTIVSVPRALDRRGALQLWAWSNVLICLRLGKRPPAILFRRWLRAQPGSVRHLVATLLNPHRAIGYLARTGTQALAEREWRTRSQDPAGSEMYLVFRAGAAREGTMR